MSHVSFPPPSPSSSPPASALVSSAVLQPPPSTSTGPTSTEPSLPPPGFLTTLNDIADDGPPPEYDGVRRLIPIQPCKNSRYQIRRRARMQHRPIPPGPVDRNHNDRPIPSGWHKMIHPEGQLYFYNPTSRIVTEAYLHDHLLLAKVTFWTNHVLGLAMTLSIEPPLSSELFLEIDESIDCCRYYFVDHATRGVFWLDAGSTDQLELPAVSSDDHLKILLEEQYWNHVEYFPNHIKLAPNVEFELRAMLTHTAIDSFTSDQSTAPYTMQQSQDFLNLIGNLPTTPESNSHKNSIIARLMGEFALNKYVNHSGERSARLARTTSLREPPQYRESKLITIMYTLCFGIPSGHEAQLESLWTDEIAFSAHWRKFMQQRTNDWREQAICAIALAILEALAFLAPVKNLEASPIVALITQISAVMVLIAEAFSLGGAVIAAMLLAKHRIHVNGHAMEASRYLEHTKHEYFGFRPLAIVYSIPAAFLQWALIFLVLVAFTIPVRLGGWAETGFVIIFVAIVSFTAWYSQTIFEKPDSESAGSASWLPSMCWILPWLRTRRTDYSEIPGGEV